MKLVHFLKPLAFSLVVFTFLFCKDQRETLTIFGTEVAINSKFIQQSHDRGFLKLNNLKELHYNQLPNISLTEFTEIAPILLSKTQAELRPEQIISIYIYTTNREGSIKNIDVEETHAFSIYSFSGDVLNHQYFEKNYDNEFAEISNLSTTLEGGFSHDDVRLLHFAAVGENKLPEESTIYELNGIPPNVQRESQEVDYSLRLALLLDNQRFWGASTTGLYGEELQAALMADDLPGGGGGGFCGFVNPGPSLDDGPTDPDTGCPQGADPCYNDPVGGMKKYCTKKDKGGCFAATATLMKAVDTSSDDTDVTVDFIKIWNFQDEFLLKYDLGKGYMATSLIFSLFVEPDRESLKMAKVALPLMYEAMDVLMSEDPDLDEAVVVSPELYESAMAYIKMGRQAQNKDFQKVLDSWENDLNNFLGMPKKDFIKRFESLPAASF